MVHGENLVPLVKVCTQKFQKPISEERIEQLKKEYESLPADPPATSD